MQFVEQKFIPVIIGADITAYSLMRAFYQEYKVKSVLVNMSPDSPFNTSVLCVARSFPDLEHQDTFIESLHAVHQEFGHKKLILIGCGDWYVRMIIEQRALLQDKFVIPYIEEELLNRLTNKADFYALCAKLDIPHPETVVVDPQDPVIPPLPFKYPIIAKTANSARYHYAQFPGKKKVYRIAEPEELNKVMANIRGSNYRDKFIIQDTIPGDDSNMRLLTCYSDQNGKVVFAAVGHVLLEEHTPSASGNPCTVINTVCDEIVAHAKKLLEHVGYTGFSNFDLKYDHRDGKYKFFEINVRLGRSNYYITGSGFNPVRYIVDDLIEGKSFEMTVADKEHLFTFVPMGIVRRYVRNQEMLEKAEKLYRSGQWSNPLFYPEERSLKMKLYAHLANLNQWRKFKRYFPTAEEVK